ncbi:MAG: acyltransferase [Bacteroidia bacterium]|nr:acyltransferase [Bacteroidia bacterium]
MSREGHIPQLDGLRFYAISSVLVAHWVQWNWSDPFWTKFPFVHGVTLFFVLSGFLITRNLLNSNDSGRKPLKSLWSFYVRRVLRIFPIYYLSVFTLYLIDYENTREIFPWLVSYTSNIYQSMHNAYIGNFNHFWSLAVEEQFYLIWPLFILFIRPRYSIYVIAGAVLLSVLSRLYFSHSDLWMATNYFTTCNLHSLGLGALMAWLSIYHPGWSGRLLSLPLLIGGITLYLGTLFLQLYPWAAWYREAFDSLLFSCIAALIVFRCATSGFKGIFGFMLHNKLVIFGGKISYGMYVFHLFIPVIYETVLNYFGMDSSANNYYYWTLFILLVALASGSWYIVERPVQSLKKYFLY